MQVLNSKGIVIFHFIRIIQLSRKNAIVNKLETHDEYNISRLR